jgi:hypothetical protein
MVPLVAVKPVGRVVGVAVLLLLADERPLLIQLHRAGVGGKGHEFVVEPPGVLAGGAGQAAYYVLADADQARRLADAAAIGEVAEDGQEFLVGQGQSNSGVFLRWEKR